MPRETLIHFNISTLLNTQLLWHLEKYTVEFEESFFLLFLYYK